MRVPAIAALLAALPVTADALSCMRPDPVARFEQARDDAAPWMVIDGMLDFDPARLPQPLRADPNRTDGPASIPARVEGRALSEDGFTEPVTAAATIEAACAGPWCPAAAPGRHLIFARVEDGALRIALGPCPGEITPDPDRAVLRAIERCMAGESCAPVLR